MVTRSCGAQHPTFPQVRCEEPRGHDDDHYNSFYARRWENEPLTEALIASGEYVPDPEHGPT